MRSPLLERNSVVLLEHSRCCTTKYNNNAKAQILTFGPSMLKAHGLCRALMSGGCLGTALVRWIGTTVVVSNRDGRLAGRAAHIFVSFLFVAACSRFVCLARSRLPGDDWWIAGSWSSKKRLRME